MVEEEDKNHNHNPNTTRSGPLKCCRWPKIEYWFGSFEIFQGGTSPDPYGSAHDLSVLNFRKLPSQ